MSIEPINLREIEEHASNIYEAIIICGLKGRQFNDENKIEYNAILSTIPETTGEEETENMTNPAQLKISLEFEKRKKPHIQALNDFLKEGIDFKYKEKQSSNTEN